MDWFILCPLCCLQGFTIWNKSDVSQCLLSTGIVSSVCGTLKQHLVSDRKQMRSITYVLCLHLQNIKLYHDFLHVGSPPQTTGALSYLFHPCSWKLLSPPAYSRPNIHQQFNLLSAFDKPSSEQQWAFSSVHLVHWLDTNLTTIYTVVSVSTMCLVALLEASVRSACHTISRFRIHTVVCMLYFYCHDIVGWWDDGWGRGELR